MRLPSDDAELRIPYLLRPSKEILDDSVDDWAKICGADVTSSIDDLSDGKNVINLDVTSDEGEYNLQGF